MENGNIAVDSLKLRIPILRVKVIDSLFALEHFIITDKQTGETFDSQETEFEFKKHCKTIEESGIKTRYAVEKQQTSFNTTEEFLIILLNAKILKEAYFQGITFSNIADIHKSLIGHNIVDFPIDYLLQAEVTDCDFKRDIIFQGDYMKMFKVLYMQTRETRQSERGARLFDQKGNQGIQWSKRETTQFKRSPYLKLYHKETELSNRSFAFKEAFLASKDCKNRIRIEATVKNKKHFRALFGENFDTSLNNVLRLSNDQKEKIIQTAVKAHIQPIAKKCEVPKTMKDADIILYNAVSFIMEKGLSFELVKDLLIHGIESRSQVSKKKKQLDSLYSRFIQGTRPDAETKEMQTIFQALGLL